MKRKRDSWDLSRFEEMYGGDPRAENGIMEFDGFEEMYGGDPSPEGRGWREAPGEGYLISCRARL
jgi:hypothetical protein